MAVQFLLKLRSQMQNIIPEKQPQHSEGAFSDQLLPTRIMTAAETFSWRCQMGTAWGTLETVTISILMS